MKSISIKCTKREVVGKKEAKRLRGEGLVPGVLYGGEEPIHFYAPERIQIFDLHSKRLSG